jgi:hypothetical protein
VINIAAQSIFGHNQAVWIGINDRSIENSYVNTDGSKMDWLNWNKGEPNDMNHNEDCVEFHTYDGHWNDNKCKLHIKIRLLHLLYKLISLRIYIV